MTKTMQDRLTAAALHPMQARSSPTNEGLQQEDSMPGKLRLGCKDSHQQRLWSQEVLRRQGPSAPHSIKAEQHMLAAMDGV